MPLSASFSSGATQNDQQATALGGATGKTSSLNTASQITLTEGTGAGNANITLQKTITLNAGNSYTEVLDIFAGS